MKRMTRMLLSVAGLFVLLSGSAVAGNDQAGCQDHPLFTRMPGSWIHSCAQKDFDSHAFPLGKGKTEKVEGRLWTATYYPQSDLKSKPSELQILRNFENAAKKLGGTVLAAEKTKETLKLAKDGKEFWVDIWAEFTGKYGLTIVEKSPMAQDITANAEVFSNDIRTTGHAAVYGIYFDTGKSVVKAESDAALGEIGKLLKADAGLKVYVVGHTDNVGGMDSNMKLSQARAEAVMNALVGKYGIAAARLKSYGVASLAPVAPNDTEVGRAKNRRVELVKQ
jgi:OmpA-OmpF porin, OOP family